MLIFHILTAYSVVVSSLSRGKLNKRRLSRVPQHMGVKCIYGSLLPIKGAVRNFGIAQKIRNAVVADPGGFQICLTASAFRLVKIIELFEIRRIDLYVKNSVKKFHLRLTYLILPFYRD